MEILTKMSSFNEPIPDMLTAYKTFIRSILEQSCVIWHSSLSQEDREGLERVQKIAFRNIPKGKDVIHEKEQEKYLGDILSSLGLSASVRATVKDRTAKVKGSIYELRAVVEDVRMQELLEALKQP